MAELVHLTRWQTGQQYVRTRMMPDHVREGHHEEHSRETTGCRIGSQSGGSNHDLQSDGDSVTSGGGTIFPDGYIVNGRHNTQAPQGGPNGPTCGGMAYGVKKVAVKVGDVVIVPPGVVHGWADIPDHVDYLSFRPSQRLLQPGWVNPTIAK